MGLLDKPAGRTIKRAALVCFLILLGLAVVEVILFIYGDRAEEVYIGNEHLAFSPTYNRNGSWMHGQLQIGYHPWILLAEDVAMLWLLWFLYRVMAWMNLAFDVSDRWFMGMDFCLATGIARFITVLRGRFTLDYIYIIRLNTIYDLFDFYLYFGLSVVLAWCVVCEVRYWQVKKRETAGMSYLQKMKWMFQFTGNSFKAPFIPSKNWADILERKGYFLKAQEELEKEG